MTHKSPTPQARHLLVVIIGLLLFMVFLLFVYSKVHPNTDAPRAERGTQDLSDWDFEAGGHVYLNGSWEFYSGELLDPEDFRKAADLVPPVYLAVPYSWKGSWNSENVQRQGYGTYRLHLIVSKPDEVYGLKINNVRMSHRLYINGKLAGSSGTPAASADEHQPGNTPYTLFFHTDTAEVEIVLQVANYLFPTGGIVTGISFGRANDIMQQSEYERGTVVGILLLLFLFSLYHIGIYVMGRRDRTYLLIGLFLAVSVCLHLVYDEKILLQLFPEIPFLLAYKTLELTIFLSFILFTLIICSVHEHLLTMRMQVMVLSPVTAYCISILVLPYTWHMSVRYVLFIYVILVWLILIARLVMVFLRTPNGEMDRIEMLLFMVGFISILIYIISGLLYGDATIPTDVTEKVALFAFILFMNLLLMLRFTKSYDRNEKLTQQLEQSNQLKDEFLMVTTHELKTPLHGIMNTTSFLLEEDSVQSLNEKQKRYLWLIKDTSTKLSMLIRDLLDVIQLKYDDFAMESAVVDVRVAVQMALELLRFELADKPVAFINEVEPGTYVLADENRFRQVLYNLIHNAIKHTEEGRIRIDSERQGGQVVLIVEDTGSGISENEFERIFHYFEQLKPRVEGTDQSGMGIGLYVSKKLIERMGGNIWVERSEVGRGTEMRLCLPKAEYDSSQSEESAAAEPHSRIATHDIHADWEQASRHTHTILIVDDEPSNIQVLYHLLSGKYNVIKAYSAKGAMDVLEKHSQIDLVITDVMMPDTSGISLCRMLRKRYSILELPVLLATVRDTPQDVVIGFEAGANDYVVKPFDPTILLARIHTLLMVKTTMQEALNNEYAFYQAQIKPHFLYNALSSVISYCYTDGDKAAHLLSRLSEYLQFKLELDRSVQFIPLHRELKLIEAYVDIERARFGERFTYHCEIDDSLRYVQIPVLSIQPIVENAIRHGLFKKKGQGNVWVEICKQEDIVVTVRDDGIGIAEEQVERLLQAETAETPGQGIGISNIRNRLQMIPGSKLEIRSKQGEGTTITMTWPWNRAGVYREKGE